MKTIRHPRSNMQNAFVLALALGLVAACNGPTVRHESSSAGQYAVEVHVDPPNLQDGQKATFSYGFTNTRTGKPEVALPVVYGGTVRTTLVNHDLTWFRTGVASGPVAGVYPVNLRFGPPDSYRLYSEFTSAYTPTARLLYTETTAFGQDAPSLEQPAALAPSADLQSSFYGVVVKLDTGGALRAGQPATFHYTLSQVGTGTPVRDANPLDGAAAHLYVISADGEEFSHLVAREPPTGAMNAENEPTSGGSSGSQSGNPLAPGRPGATPIGGGTPAVTPTIVGTTAPTAGTTALASGTAGPTAGTAGQSAAATPTPAPGLGPDLTFAPTFTKPGLYKAWLQFLYHGQVVTADYVVNVTQ